ncbi:MAG: hypothetical protein RIR16_361 [Actinomycetota bacterium]
MITWLYILLGAALVYSWKLIGYLLPARLLDRPLVQRSAEYLTIALLAALFAIQGFGSANQVVLDERAVGLLVAVLALVLRLPFIAVVFLAAAASAFLRLAL